MHYTKNNPGVSLIEVTISVALVMLIVTLSIPLFVIHKRLFVKAEVENLYGCMLYLQRKAYLERKAQQLVIAPEINGYKINGKQMHLASAVIFGKAPSSIDKSLKSKKISTFKNNTLYFYPDGTITSGTIYLTDAQGSCAYAITCGVAQVGFVRKYRYDDNKWVLLT